MLIFLLLGVLIVCFGILFFVYVFVLDNVCVVLLFIFFVVLSLVLFVLYGWWVWELYLVMCLGGGKCEMFILMMLLFFSVVLLIVLVGMFYFMIYGLMGWGRFLVGVFYFNCVMLLFGLLMLVVIVLVIIRSCKVFVCC